MWKKWVQKWLSVNLCLMGILLIASLLILTEFRENYGDDYILANYQRILYGSAVTNGAAIKFKIVEEKQPKVMAIGSSRVMQFRDNYFHGESFYTMGGTVGSIEDAQIVFDRVKKLCKPDVVILGVDLWWLNPNFAHVISIDAQENIQNSISKKMFQMWSFMATNSEMRQMVFRPDKIKAVDDLGGRENVGLSAAAKSNGYRMGDGSYQYGELIAGKIASKEELFKDTHNRLQNKNRRFEAAEDIDYEELAKLESLIAAMQAEGCHVIVFLPPFPDEIYSILAHDDNWRYMMKNFEGSVSEYCRNQQVQFYDFSNVLWFGSNDDECIDGFHGSEVAYAKIARAMCQDEVFARYVAQEYLDKIIASPTNRFQAVPLSE